MPNKRIAYALTTPLIGYCARVPGPDGLDKYAGHTCYRAVNAHGGRDANEGISGPNKSAPSLPIWRRRPVGLARCGSVPNWRI
jgi:hypothetical protein